MSKLIDTIVVGAGWAGVVAARDLVVKGHSVLVLEARERIGGRAWTCTHGMHAPVDLGCSWIHGYKEGNPARELTSAVGVNVHLPKPTEGVVYGPDGPLSPSVASRLRSSLSAALSAAHSFAQTSLPTANASTPLSDFLLSPSSPLFDSFDASSVEGFARSLEFPIGAPLEKVSLRWTGWEDAFAGSDAAPENGYQPLVEKVFDEARKLGAVIRFSELVKSLERCVDGGVTVQTDKAVYDARTVVCTIPLGVLKHSPPAFDPPLPPRRREVIAGTYVGVLEKLVLAYPVAWWAGGSSISSFTFLPTQSASSQELTNPESILASHTLVMSSFAAPALPDPHPTLLFYLSSTPAQMLARFPPNDVAHAAHAFLLRRLKPASPPPEPTASVLTNWMNDPFARGATTTPSVVGEGRSPLDFMELGKPLWDGRLGFAGEHTDANHRGSVAGAIVSGQREASRVGKLLANISDP